MGKIKNENYFQVSGWMVNELGLSGNELMIFAIIYGFSQTEDCKFTGSLNYLCEFINASKPTVIKALKSLEDKKFIVKTQKIINNISFNEYAVTLPVVKNLYQGSKETLLGGSKESLPNNIYNNNIYNTNTINSISKGETKKPLIKKSSSTKKSKRDKFIEHFLTLADEYEFSDDVLDALAKFINSLADTKTYLGDETIRAQLSALVDQVASDRQRIAVINDTIVRGWKSLIYCIDSLADKKTAKWDTAEMSCEQNDNIPGTEDFEEKVARGDINIY